MFGFVICHGNENFGLLFFGFSVKYLVDYYCHTEINTLLPEYININN